MPIMTFIQRVNRNVFLVEHIDQLVKNLIDLLKWVINFKIDNRFDQIDE